MHLECMNTNVNGNINIKNIDMSKQTLPVSATLYEHILQKQVVSSNNSLDFILSNVPQIFDHQFLHLAPRPILFISAYFSYLMIVNSVHLTWFPDWQYLLLNWKINTSSKLIHWNLASNRSLETWLLKIPSITHGMDRPPKLHLTTCQLQGQVGTCGCLFRLKGRNPPQKIVEFCWRFFFGGNGRVFFAALKNLFNPAMFGECSPWRPFIWKRWSVWGGNVVPKWDQWNCGSG